MALQPNNPFELVPQPAANPNSPELKFITSPLGWVTILANILFVAVLSLSVISLIVSGIRYVLSRGDVKATQTAQTHLMYSIVALIGAVAAYTILIIIKNALNVTYPAPFRGFF